VNEGECSSKDFNFSPRARHANALRLGARCRRKDRRVAVASLNPPEGRTSKACQDGIE